MEIAGERGDSVYLRGFGDYERSSLKLTAAEQAGVGHIAYRTYSAEALERRVEALEAAGVEGGWLDGDLGHGPAYSFLDPDGHRFELFYESERYEAPPELRPGAEEPAAALPGRAASESATSTTSTSSPSTRPRTASSSRSTLGLRLTEQIVLDDGTEAGVWLTAGQKSYDVTYTRDLTRTRGRLHHIAFFVDQREDVLRAADIFLEHGIVMESGPHKHAIQQTFFLYTWEPGGNRVEVCSGGFLIFAPDHEPVVWSQAERAKGQAWGMQTVAAFHIKGTPPVPAGGRASCRPLSRRRVHASSSVAPTICTSTSSRISRNGGSTISVLPAGSRSSGWQASCSSRITRRPRSGRPSCAAPCPGVRALGAITLNAGVGGLNALAVEIAAREGARIVWLPTVDAENEAGADSHKPVKQPVWRTIQDEFVRAGVANGPVQLAEAVSRKCSTSSHATTSCSPLGTSGGAEIRTVVDAALAAGVSHVIVTHPDYPTQGVPIEEQRELAQQGAMLERCFAPIHTGKVSWEQTFAAIRATGPEHNVLSTDLGQVANPPVEDGLALMADRLLEAGFSEHDVHTMAVVNSRKLAGA